MSFELDARRRAAERARGSGPAALDLAYDRAHPAPDDGTVFGGLKARQEAARKLAEDRADIWGDPVDLSWGRPIATALGGIVGTIAGGPIGSMIGTQAGDASVSIAEMSANSGNPNADNTGKLKHVLLPLIADSEGEIDPVSAATNVGRATKTVVGAAGGGDAPRGAETEARMPRRGLDLYSEPSGETADLKKAFELGRRRRPEGY